MSESAVDVSQLPRAEGYAQLAVTLTAMLDGLSDDIARMATFASVIHHGFGFLWTGFYRVTSPGILTVGPYQGQPGCVQIPFGKGVCGQAAASRRTIVVDDVRTHPGHITCDAASRSEIVVPVFDRSEVNLVAVLDIDSTQLAAFTDVDARSLASLVRGLVG